MKKISGKFDRGENELRKNKEESIKCDFIGEIADFILKINRRRMSRKS